MLRFANKAVIITGASSGIGEAAALAFAKDGAKLTITGRNKERLAGVARECRKFEGCEVHEVVSDLSVFDNLKPVISETVEKFKGVDVLVNNAGAGAPLRPVEFLQLENYEEIFNTNVRAPLFLSKFALPHLKRTKGCIVNISSSGSARCYANYVPYLMSKSALDHFTRGFAAENASYGVRANTVNPAVVKTRFHYNFNLSDEELGDLSTQNKLRHKFGIIPAEEVTNAIIFACISTHMTGSSIYIDSGYLLSD